MWFWRYLVFTFAIIPWPGTAAAQLGFPVLPVPPPVSSGRWASEPRVRSGAPTLVGQAAFLLDDTTGRTLYAYHADALRYPASTVKMLTAIVVARRLSPAKIITVPAEAIVNPSIFTSARLYAGERVTVRNLLYGLLLPSGDDAAGQYTTARDLGWLAHTLLRTSLLAGIVRTRTYHGSSVDGRYQHTWTNLNRLLWSYPGAIGVKTGTTPLAGANLVAAASRRGHRIIAVVMGSSAASRFDDGAKLLNYGCQLLDRRRVLERSRHVSVLSA